MDEHALMALAEPEDDNTPQQPPDPWGEPTTDEDTKGEG